MFHSIWYAVRIGTRSSMSEVLATNAASVSAPSQRSGRRRPRVRTRCQLVAGKPNAAKVSSLWPSTTRAIARHALGQARRRVGERADVGRGVARAEVQARVRERVRLLERAHPHLAASAQQRVKRAHVEIDLVGLGVGLLPLHRCPLDRSARESTKDRAFLRACRIPACRTTSRYDALGLAELVRKGEMSRRRAARRGAGARRSRTTRAERGEHESGRSTRARAIRAGLPDGPFRGVPFLLKDLHAQVAGEPLTLRLASVRVASCPRPTARSRCATGARGS